MRRLKTTEVAPYRVHLLTKQGMRCALCQLPCPTDKAVLDHCHKTGLVRGTLHRNCNSLLGAIERGMVRYGVTNLAAFGHGVSRYLSANETSNEPIFHPTWKTEEEKRERRNAMARKRRAASNG